MHRLNLLDSSNHCFPCQFYVRGCGVLYTYSNGGSVIFTSSDKRVTDFQSLCPAGVDIRLQHHCGVFMWGRHLNMTLHCDRHVFRYVDPFLHLHNIFTFLFDTHSLYKGSSLLWFQVGECCLHFVAQVFYVNSIGLFSRSIISSMTLDPMIGRPSLLPFITRVGT